MTDYRTGSKLCCVYILSELSFSNVLFITKIIQLTWILVLPLPIVFSQIYFPPVCNGDNTTVGRVKWELFEIIYTKNSRLSTFQALCCLMKTHDVLALSGLYSTSVQCFSVWFLNQWSFPGQCLGFIPHLPQELAQCTVNSKYSTELIWVAVYHCDVNRSAV